jgi:hypothetical protein
VKNLIDIAIADLKVEAASVQAQLSLADHTIASVPAFIGPGEALLDLRSNLVWKLSGMQTAIVQMSRLS